MSLVALLVALIAALFVTKITILQTIAWIDLLSFPYWLTFLLSLGVLSWLIGD